MPQLVAICRVCGRRIDPVGHGPPDHLGHPRITLQAADHGSILFADPILDADQALDGQLRRGHLAEGGKNLGDVAEEDPVRADDEQSLAFEDVAVLVEQEGGSVQPNSGLAGAGAALDDDAAVERSPDDDVLLRLDRGHDIAHLSGPASADLGQQRIGDVCPRIDGPRSGQVLVQDVNDLTALHQEPPPKRQTHGVGNRGPIERHRHRGPPVGHHRLPGVVFHMTAPDVARRRRRLVDTPEAQWPAPGAQ